MCPPGSAPVIAPDEGRPPSINNKPPFRSVPVQMRRPDVADAFRDGGGATGDPAGITGAGTAPAAAPFIRSDGGAGTTTVPLAAISPVRVRWTEGGANVRAGCSGTAAAGGDLSLLLRLASS